MTNPIDLTVGAARLWFRAATFTVKAASIPLELSVRVAGAVLDRVHPTDSQPEDTPPAAPPAVVVVEEPEPPAAPAPSPKQRRRAARREPTRGEASRQRRARAEQEEADAQATDDLPTPGPEIEVAEPWEGYADMAVVDVLARLAEADDTTRAAVRLYELAHERREAILHVTEG
jgi:hypothetical protein